MTSDIIINIDPEIARLCDAGRIEDYPTEAFVTIAQRLAERAPIARRHD